MPWRVPCETLDAVHPAVDLTLRLVLGDAIALLNATDELILLAVDDREIVFGQLAPLLLHLAGQLLPIAFNTIPVHVLVLTRLGVRGQRHRRGAVAGQKSFAPRPAICHL